MKRVHSVSERPLDQVGSAALAISELASNQRHIGILHRDTDANRLLVLELQWHFRLKNDPPSWTFLWIDPAIHPTRLIQLAAICRLVWRANQAGSVPYGFSEPADCLDQATCKFLVGPTKLGLTCASFVLAVFHRAGMPLVDYASWPADRADDRDWQEAIIGLLQKHGASAEHVNAIRGEVGGGAVRYRPEEVAGAATEAAVPIAFSLASTRAAEILDRLSSR